LEVVVFILFNRNRLARAIKGSKKGKGHIKCIFKSLFSSTLLRNQWPKEVISNLRLRMSEDYKFIGPKA
jgi:hypothetical protein